MSTKANGGACAQFYEYMRFLEEARKGNSGNIALHDHGVMLISTEGKLSVKVKCDLNSAWNQQGMEWSVIARMIESGKPYAKKLDQATRFPIFLESYYRKIEPAPLDATSMCEETRAYLNKVNVTAEDLAKRDGLAEDEDREYFCAWLKDTRVYDSIVASFCILPVKSAMSIVLADRLGRLYAEDADIEIVRSVDIDTWNITVAANSAKQPRFGRFV